MNGYRWLPVLSGLLALPMGGSHAGAEFAGAATDPGVSQRQAHFLVSTRVAPIVRLDSSQAPASFTLDADDLARGFKDVEARYRLTSNVARGCMLRFSVREGLAREIEVHGLGAPLAIGPLGSEVWHGRAVAGDGEFTLKYRLHVDARLAPGRYPLPVDLAAVPVGPEMPST